MASTNCSSAFSIFLSIDTFCSSCDCVLCEAFEWLPAIKPSSFWVFGFFSYASMKSVIQVVKLLPNTSLKDNFADPPFALREVTENLWDFFFIFDWIGTASVIQAVHTYLVVLSFNCRVRETHFFCDVLSGLFGISGFFTQNFQQEFLFVRSKCSIRVWILWFRCWIYRMSGERLNKKATLKKNLIKDSLRNPRRRCFLRDHHTCWKNAKRWYDQYSCF